MTKITIESNGKIDIDGKITKSMKFNLLRKIAGHDTVIINLYMSEDGGFDWIKNINPIITQCRLAGKLGDDIAKELENYRLYLPDQE